MRSDNIKKGFERAPHRSLLKATGIVKDEDFAKPFIAIVNSYVDIVPGHVHLQDFGLKIKEAAGSAHGYSNRALFLLRGEDKSGRNNFTLGHE